MPKFIPGTTIPYYSCIEPEPCPETGQPHPLFSSAGESCPYCGIPLRISTQKENKVDEKNKISICTKVSKGDETRENILNKIITYITEHGYAPSVRELCELTGLKSTSTVHRHLNIMLKKGMIETDSPEGSPRAIRVPHYKFVKEEE